MPVWIHRIETILPEFFFSQEAAGAKMIEWTRDERHKRIVRAIYRKSGIETRHSVIRDFEGGPGSLFREGADGVLRGPGTGARNEIYARESRTLSVALARNMLDGAAGFGPRDITHVVTVSCTGFYNPGPDYYVMKELGIPEAAERYHLGFMGCYAAFPGLRMAAHFCRANPDAAVLVLCIELCSLHFQLNGSEDQILANSLFADGAAAALVSARPPAPGRPAYRLGDFHSALVPGGEADMTWRIGDNGFDIALSSYVPKIIGACIRGLVEPALARSGLGLSSVDTWAVHPGGKTIIDQVEVSLGLAPAQVGASREVLRRCGNMSSPTVLFVLRDILKRPAAGNGLVCALAFGPGLTVEMALLSAEGVPGRGSEAAPGPSS